ncbi:RNA-directed DNA polymerase from mobile element jockey [Stylophora pistillata]|uniref:RNA-directed DNA polymerase from mobile element jockey n=1 Tax=Stylophora pistillata TaxID=50429 RepID=A0A2B4SAS0_STYPI|nr:RNA-directed DNA polymerase from mobile element jockey [Stylophora pistillata]
MINDLAIETPLLSSHWKYVDDLTISEAIPSGGTSSLQKDLDAIAQWSSRNNMNLNPKKCKELVISSLRTRPDLGPLCVNGRPLERVSSHKVLGVTISDTLGWNEHVREIVSKASKRLYILRVLKRSGIPPEDLINIFYALVRSVLEYACVTWSTSLPIYLKDMIERVQKRALRILFPALSYKDAIVAANSTRLNKHMPNFSSPCTQHCRAIIDAHEIKVQAPSSLVLNSEMYPSHESHTTYQGNVVISPSGEIIHTSSLFEGSISDKELIKQSSLLPLLQPGDQIMADKGFVIQDILTPLGCSVVMPSFLSSKQQFSKGELRESKKIHILRVHVERAIRRVEEFHFFDRVIPLTMAGSINQI